MKVGYLGPKGTFSAEAAEEYCTNAKGNIQENNYFDDKEICINPVEMVEYRTITETIIALEKGEIEEAVIPIENSLQGCVTDAIDTLIQNKDINVHVIDEILLEIKQNLMTNIECKLDDIKVVYSHPQAIAQCSKFIESKLSNAEIIPMESTAIAAKKVSESKEFVACIGNIACLKEYGLKLLCKDIQDNNYNKTRFWVLSKSKDTTKNKTKMSMIFSVKDKPGALYNVLEIFNKYNLNLTKIESRPAKTVLGEYIFWIDVSIKEGIEEKAIQDIKEKGIYVRILGKY